MSALAATLARRDELRDRFAAGAPRPHVVIDGFLDPALADALVAEFPAPDEMPRSRDYVFGNKRELSSVQDRGGASAAYAGLVLSPDFAELITHVVGQPLFVDDRFHGGGFHQGADGSFLDMHVDFNVHPLHEDWLRVANVLLYLNPGWREEWHGELRLAGERGGEPALIAPLHNRAVIMLTDDHSFHGYDKLSLPAGVTRRSIATYAYTLITPGSVEQHTTGWAPEQAGLGKRLLANNYDRLVKAKTRAFGSATARNR